MVNETAAPSASATAAPTAAPTGKTRENHDSQEQESSDEINVSDNGGMGEPNDDSSASSAGIFLLTLSALMLAL